MKSTENNVKQVISSLLDAFENDNQEIYLSVCENSEVIKATSAAKKGDAEEFFIWLIYPFSKFIDGLLSNVTNSEKAMFFLKHGEFVERHFNKLIDVYEGTPCCSDKSRTIMHALIKFHMIGKLMSFNYDQEYTYHLPTIVFNDHDKIIEFSDALYSLYYGNSELYFKAMLNITKNSKTETVE